MYASNQNSLAYGDGDGVEVGQAIGHISEDAGLVREGNVGGVEMQLTDS